MPDLTAFANAFKFDHIPATMVDQYAALPHRFQRVGVDHVTGRSYPTARPVGFDVRPFQQVGHSAVCFAFPSGSLVATS